MLRWEYTDPFEYAIVISEGMMMIKDDNGLSTFDVSSNRMFGQLNNLLVGIVDGSILNSNNFTTVIKENESYYSLEMKPADNELSEFLELILLKLNKTDLTVDEILMMEPSSDYTQISFTNKSLNEELPVGIFDLD